MKYRVKSVVRLFKSIDSAFLISITMLIVGYGMVTFPRWDSTAWLYSITGIDGSVPGIMCLIGSVLMMRRPSPYWMMLLTTPLYWYLAINIAYVLVRPGQSPVRLGFYGGYVALMWRVYLTETHHRATLD